MLCKLYVLSGSNWQINNKSVLVDFLKRHGKGILCCLVLIKLSSNGIVIKFEISFLSVLIL